MKRLFSRLPTPHSRLPTPHSLLPPPHSLLPLYTIACLIAAAPTHAAQPLYLSYPPANHETVADRIFLIGTAPPGGTVLVNGQAIVRNTAGHFAPSFPLHVGQNRFDLRYGKQTVTVTVTRLAATTEQPAGLAFVKDSLSPAVDIARLPDEWLCFTAIAPPTASVSVKLAEQTIPLIPRPKQVELPENASVLTQQNHPVAIATTGRFEGCTHTVLLGDLGKPSFQLTQAGQTIQQTGFGSIKILSPTHLETAAVTAESGTARTGPNTDYSRLTPLPKGTQALVTGYEGDWARLDYGAWIKRSEVQILPTGAPPKSIIRSIKARQTGDWTEVVFPLQVPVPMSVQQGDRTFTLTLYNTTAQTDIIHLDDDPLIERLDWQQIAPGQIQYRFNLKSSQQWGYKLRYEGTTLVLSLKHPPGGGSRESGVGNGGSGIGRQGKQLRIPNSELRTPNSELKTLFGLSSDRKQNFTPHPTPHTPHPTPLAGTKILLDPGHGGTEDLGSRGPTGYPEKTVALLMAKLVRDRLQQRGATVYLTRETDVDVPLQDRVALIEKVQPTLALSLHYNALPDDGDAIKTKGVAAFWYNTQAHSLAVFLHNYLTKTLKRSSYGVFWDNLALTRPTTTPSVLLELGFMINPDEFEWITNPKEQQRLASAIADGITAWLQQSRP